MARFRRPFGFPTRTGPDIRADVRDEIAFHLEMRTRELMERGWPADLARAEARRQFGDPDATADYCRRLDADKERGMHLQRYLDELRQDLTHGVRMLARQPALSATLLLTIALGIGATALVFSVVHTALLAPLPYAQADRLMHVRLSLPDYDDMRASATAFEQAGVWGSNLYMYEEEQILGGVVSPSLFATLGVAPLLGRVPAEGDGASPVVVLSHGFWRRRLGGDPHVIGKSIRLWNETYTVVGVMPPRFRFPSRAFELWVNIDYALTKASQQAQNRALRIFSAVGRLQPGVTPEQARSELAALSRRLQEAHPTTNDGFSLTPEPLRERLVGDSRTALLVALGAVAGLLIIACVNVANLMLARMTTRTQELAVRAALGAGRGRLARQLVTESFLIVFCGGAVGLLLSGWGVSALPRLIGDRVPLVDDVAVNVPVILVSLAAIVACGVLVGLAPVAQLSGGSVEPALRAGGRGNAGAPAGGRLRSTLVVVQIAVAVVVLSGGFVLTRSLIRLLNADTGFSADRVLAFHLLLLHQPTSEGRVHTAARTLETLAALPGVEAVGGATGLALVNAQRGTTFEVEGHADAAADRRRAYFIAASPGYVEALRVRLLAGRSFAATDSASSPSVAVVSQTLARRFFPDAAVAVGRRIRLVNPEYSGEWRTIVGVVADVRYQGLDDANAPVLYTPFAQTPFPWMYVHVRAVADPLASVNAIRAAVRSVDGRLIVGNPQAMTAVATESSADPRFRAALISSFAALAVILAAIGLHGLVSFGVARRTREIAIRVALGASLASIRRNVFRQALTLAAAGTALGLLGAQWAGRLLSTLLYETTPHDPAALAAVALLLFVVALAAGVAPARRALRIEPVEALREG
jgi:predicted permease